MWASSLLLVAVILQSVGTYNALEFCDGTSWVKYNGNCYSFGAQKRVSYYDAENYCRSQGAHLASIHSKEENEFLLNAAKARYAAGRLWIGLNILEGKDKHRWSDDSPVDYKQIAFKEFYTNEKCFILRRSHGDWRPEHCGLHYTPICKRSENAVPTEIPPPTTALPPSGNCPEDWIKFGDKCYKFVGAKESDRKEFKSARDACWALGENVDLVSIHSEYEQAFLTQHLPSVGGSAWIGMQKIPSDEIGHDIVFGWIDNSQTVYTNWARANPPPGTWKYCGRLRYEGVAKGEWLADYCEIGKYGYICQMHTDPSLPEPEPEPSPCDSKSTLYGESCYRYVSEPQKHDEAEKICQGYGGHLLSVDNGFEQAFLVNFVGERCEQLLTGLKSVEGTQYLRWSDKSPVYYTNFALNEPQFTNSKSSCVVLDPTNGLKWRTNDCDAALPFVCEKGNETHPAFKETLGPCPEQQQPWIDIGDESCYHTGSADSEYLSWDTTSRYCSSKGMKMVKGYSNHQMLSLAARLWTKSLPVHLSLIRSFDKKTFTWLDSSPLNYTNWDSREPSSYPGERNCVSFDQSTGKWRTISCSEGGVAFCQTNKMIL